MIVAIRRANNFPTHIHWAESEEIRRSWYTPAICGSEVNRVDTVLDYDAFKRRHWKSFKICSKCWKKISLLDPVWVEVVKQVLKNNFNLDYDVLIKLNKQKEEDKMKVEEIKEQIQKISEKTGDIMKERGEVINKIKEALEIWKEKTNQEVYDEELQRLKLFQLEDKIYYLKRGADVIYEIWEESWDYKDYKSAKKVNLDEMDYKEIRNFVESFPAKLAEYENLLNEKVETYKKIKDEDIVK